MVSKEISSGIDPCFKLAEGLCKFCANTAPEENTNTAPTTHSAIVLQAQANPLLSTCD
jgi:hypothetical protein